MSINTYQCLGLIYVDSSLKPQAKSHAFILKEYLPTGTYLFNFLVNTHTIF